MTSGFGIEAQVRHMYASRELLAHDARPTPTNTAPNHPQRPLHHPFQNAYDSARTIGYANFVAQTIKLLNAC